MKSDNLRTDRYLRTLKLRPNLREILIRMDQGDFIEDANCRIFLKSGELTKRPTIQIKRSAVDALNIRGLVYPATSNGGAFVYNLTEDGEFTARLLVQS